jgi:acyl carrier protein
MLELSMDLEADLGIDSIKRVEILGALEDKYPTLPSADTEVLAQTRTLQEIVDYMKSETGAPAASIQKTDFSPAVQETRMESSLAAEGPSDHPANETAVSSQESKTASISFDELTAVLLEIVAEKTGYPAEMLEAEMDMEADLGIDSIKRVEILGAMEERVPGLPTVEAETLAELRTLGQIADLMSGSSSSGAGSLSPAPEEKKKVKSVDLQNTPVELLSLAAPDRLDFLIPTEHPVIVTNEGTAFTEQVVNDLTANGWKVAVWDYPANLITPGKQSFGPDITRLKQDLSGKAAIDTTLDSFRKKHIRLAGLIHLHPLSAGSELFSNQETELVKQLFLAAGSLKSDFEEADAGTRTFFLTVTRTDGVLGVHNQSSYQEGSGLTGLAKSLSWEWPEVFCRAIDLDRSLKDDHASHLILQELHDPDQGLLEVGRSVSGRVTLVRKNG